MTGTLPSTVKLQSTAKIPYGVASSGRKTRTPAEREGNGHGVTPVHLGAMGGTPSRPGHSRLAAAARRRGRPRDHPARQGDHRVLGAGDRVPAGPGPPGGEVPGGRGRGGPGGLRGARGRGPHRAEDVGGPRREPGESRPGTGSCGRLRPDPGEDDLGGPADRLRRRPLPPAGRRRAGSRQGRAVPRDGPRPGRRPRRRVRRLGDGAQDRGRRPGGTGRRGDRVRRPGPGSRLPRGRRTADADRPRGCGDRRPRRAVRVALPRDDQHRHGPRPDDRPGRGHRLRPLPHLPPPRTARRPGGRRRGIDRPRRGHRRRRGRLRRGDRDHRAGGARGHRHPVPDGDGAGRRGHRAAGGPDRPHPRTRRPRPVRGAATAAQPSQCRTRPRCLGPGLGPRGHPQAAARPPRRCDRAARARRPRQGAAPRPAQQCLAARRQHPAQELRPADGGLRTRIQRHPDGRGRPERHPRRRPHTDCD